MDKPRLKPCPFCGSKAHINYKKTLKVYIVECTNDDCPASYMLGNNYNTVKGAVEAWNKRKDKDNENSIMDNSGMRSD